MSYQATVTEVQYMDAARNSDKFYRCYHIWDENLDGGDHRVVFQWGRRGAKGQSSVKVCRDAREATSLVLGKLHEKLDKGYLRAYDTELPGVDGEVLKLAGVGVGTGNAASSNPFVRIAVNVDTARRLAMGDSADVLKAITMRQDLLSQLNQLRTDVANAEGQVEIVDMILSQKVG